MFGKYNGFVSKARVSACMYFLVYIDNSTRRGKRCLVEKCEILQKAVCVPYRSGLVIFPMHHEVERY
jgi:hypothetical protein